MRTIGRRGPPTAFGNLAGAASAVQIVGVPGGAIAAAGVRIADPKAVPFEAGARAGPAGIAWTARSHKLEAAASIGPEAIGGHAGRGIGYVPGRGGAPGAG